MMKYECVGICRTSFKGDDDKKVDGYNLYLSEEFPPNADAEGMKVSRFFVMPNRFVNDIHPHPGDAVSVSFNRWGKVDSIEVL